MSRSSRIKVLLAIDVVFFFVEIISGYAVGSLALVADSFHMLNDVMSLIVALYAIKLTSQSATDSRYSYGWHRAEILAALVNGVFLLALCFSISLEALERFFSTPEISNPKLVIIVGCFGLASNLVGLFLFHGASCCCAPGILSVAFPKHTHSHGLSLPWALTLSRTRQARNGDECDNNIVAHDMARQRSHDDHDEHDDHSHSQASETTPLLADAHVHSSSYSAPHSHVHSGTNGHSHSHSPSPASKANGHSHGTHGHGHGHSAAGSMNMRALVLHVLGDALRNVGVIATGLVIMLAPASWNGREVYFDPAISLVIACIILGSAVPLVRSASFVHLQGVPATISIEQVRAAILAVEGVLGLHELHIWQLSESKNIVSMHVLAARERDFMPIAAETRKALHDQGIHSCTIQPEYYGARVNTANADTACLVLCPPEECNPRDNACCPPPPVDAWSSASLVSAKLHH
ncbi:cation efflux protein [Mycena leptocephala]|nr:cation efflux protein [Mycena leptocephala]